MLLYLILLTTASIVLAYSTWNLLRKNEKQEDVLAQYLNYMDRLSKQVEYMDKKLEKIDSKGTFKSDDEIGWFFDQIKVMQTQLNNFKLIDDNRDAK
jgi:hypothetical protein